MSILVPRYTGWISKMTKHEVYMRVNKGNIKSSKFIKRGAQSILNGLLEQDQRKRFKWVQVRDHAWFDGTPWEELGSRRVRPPFVPQSASRTADHSHFPKWKEPRYNKGEPLTAEEMRYTSLF